MIVLYTNVVSEAMKPDPAPAVRDWLDEQAAETLYLSSVTFAELLFGIGALPDGRRKRKLATILDGLQAPRVATKAEMERHRLEKRRRTGSDRRADDYSEVVAPGGDSNDGVPASSIASAASAKNPEMTRQAGEK